MYNKIEKLYNKRTHKDTINVRTIRQYIYDVRDNK